MPVHPVPSAVAVCHVRDWRRLPQRPALLAAQMPSLFSEYPIALQYAVRMGIGMLAFHV